jgi:sugar phosphate isomerase/epimerase
VGDVGTDETFVALAGRHGFRSVDLDPSGLIERHGRQGAKALLEQAGVGVGAVLLPVEWRTSDEAFRLDLIGLVARLDATAEVGAACFWTYLLPSVDELPGPFMATAVRRLHLVARLLEVFGFRLGLEFLGPTDLRTKWKHPFVWTIGQTLDWIRAIDRPNVGLLVDSFHWHTAGHTVADLRALRPEQIVHVHLGDAPATPIDRLPDNDRLYPGEGSIDLVGFLGALKAVGYQGIVAQEVLSPQPPVQPAEALFVRSQRGFDKVFAAAGLA